MDASCLPNLAIQPHRSKISQITSKCKILNIHPSKIYSKDQRTVNATKTIFSNQIVGGSFNMIILILPYIYCGVKQVIISVPIKI